MDNKISGRDFLCSGLLCGGMQRYPESAAGYILNLVPSGLSVSLIIHAAAVIAGIACQMTEII